MDKTSKRDVEAIVNCPIYKPSIKLNLDLVPKDSLFEKNSYLKKDLGLT